MAQAQPSMPWGGLVGVEIRLLGSVELRAHGEQIPLPSIKA